MILKHSQKISNNTKTKLKSTPNEHYLIVLPLLLAVVLLVIGVLNLRHFDALGLSRDQDLEVLAAVSLAGLGVLGTLWWTAGFLLAIWAARASITSPWISRLIPHSFSQLATVLIGFQVAVASPAQASGQINAAPAAIGQNSSVIPAPANAPGSTGLSAQDQHHDSGQSGLARKDLVQQLLGTKLTHHGAVQPPLPAWTPQPPAPQPGFFVTTPQRGLVDDEPSIEVVKPGDNLWLVVRRVLGPLASNQKIADEWPRWYHANRQLIGPDPNLLLPGQLLQAPNKKDC